MRGDYTELSVRREPVEDGQGTETSGIVVRVWGEDKTYPEDRAEILIVELRIPGHEPPPAFPPLFDLIEHVLATMEIER